VKEQIDQNYPACQNVSDSYKNLIFICHEGHQMEGLTFYAISYMVKQLELKEVKNANLQTQIVISTTDLLSNLRAGAKEGSINAIQALPHLNLDRKAVGEIVGTLLDHLKSNRDPQIQLAALATLNSLNLNDNLTLLLPKKKEEIVTITSSLIDSGRIRDPIVRDNAAKLLVTISKKLLSFRPTFT
jgi:hypothetical protein